MRLAAALTISLVLALPAAAQSASTARVSGGNVPVRFGPGMEYGIMGRVADGTEVHLDYCTRNDRWCLITDSGWVDASWLVGWSAKMQVTQPNFSGPGW